MLATQKIVFSKHIRNRANGLINVLPFKHHYQNVLSAIANIDWQQEQNSPKIQDTLTYLEFAGVSSDDTAIAYLNWLEPKLRRTRSTYDQMINCHQQELQQFIENFK